MKPDIVRVLSTPKALLHAVYLQCAWRYSSLEAGASGNMIFGWWTAMIGHYDLCTSLLSMQTATV